MRRLAGRLRALIQPKSVLGLFLSLVVLGFVFSWADVGKVTGALRRFPPILLPVLFGLALARELIRARQWRYLLRRLGLRPRWRHILLALLSGDGSQILPAGIYFQNYLLQRTSGADVGVSLAATLAMQLLEAAVALGVLCVVSVPGWSWLRPTSAVVAVGYVAFLLLLRRPAVLGWLERHGPAGGLAGYLLLELKKFLAGLDGLMKLSIILRGAGYTAAYLAFTISAFWVVVQAYGLPSIGPIQALAIYCFVLAIIILNPLPSDLGISELSGVGIFLAFGVPPAEGLTVMLIARFSTLFSVEAMAAGAFLVVRPDLSGRPASEPAADGARYDALYAHRDPASPPGR